MGEFEAGAGTDSETDRGQDEGFLARWSRRKSMARRESESLNLAPTPVSADSLEAIPKSADVDTDADTDAEPARLLTDADMPPLESLGPDSDYSGFLSRGVSEALRRKALARLFRSPAYNIVDGLDDYAEDFTKFAPLGDIVTTDMRHQLEQRLKRLTDDSADAASETETETEIETEAEAGAGIDDSDDAARLSQVDADGAKQPDQAEPLDPPEHPSRPEQSAAPAAPDRVEHRHAGDTP